ncbi:hypothetical protein BCR35DRAFT_353655 [Leucosporidium creatinivorum]|uniref:F-box domain-containing protein n=1 Tax=Leucosporidium creatinivorum TaxID=106004 RepID=A0A1Y2EUV2_9BASI|nr:hypothetical protein BCR35DRAFT_353655 [Leucosporidium creatinivorum]
MSGPRPLRFPPPLGSVSSSSSLDLSSPEPPSSPFPSSEAAKRLPLEMVEMIIKEATKRTEDSNRIGHTEPSLCLLSKAFLPIARSNLYHTLSVEHSRDELDSDDGSEFGSDSSFLNFSTDVKLRRTLKENPSLGRLCRRLTVQIYLTPNNVDLEEEPVFEWVKEVMRACPEVQDFSIGSEDMYSIEDIDSMLAELGAEGWGSQLRSLEADYWGPGLIKFLGRLPNLERLRLWDSSGFVDDWPTPSSVPFSLVYLHATERVPPPFLSTLISHSNNTLRSVALSHSLILAQPSLLPSLVALEDLTVNLMVEDQASAPTLSDDKCLSIIDAIAACTTLKALTLTAYKQSLPASLLARLPSTLISLDLTHSDTTISSVTHYLTVDHHPHLRTFSCDRQGWSLNDRAAIVQLCGEVGVELKGRALTFEEDKELDPEKFEGL